MNAKLELPTDAERAFVELGLRIVKSERLPEPTEAMQGSKWGPGAWEHEPDIVEWRKDGSPLPRLIVRNPLGALCGYVGVPEGHRLFGKDYEDVDVDVHGGLTYANSCAGRICHVAQPGETEHVWWFGFDCGHAHDLIPALAALKPALHSMTTYRTLDYVVRETENLAGQLQK